MAAATMDGVERLRADLMNAQRRLRESRQMLLRALAGEPHER